jgi:hypothetical protein
MKPLHILKPGHYITGYGDRVTFSENDLHVCANAYDPALHEAPIVIGHPTTNAPAYGWIKRLSAQGRDLIAEPQQLEPTFSESVLSGRYKKLSAAFYAPDSPHNPVPGIYYLQHVGFLGAQPPAVKGLKPVTFSEGEEGVVVLSEDMQCDHDPLFTRLRAFLSHALGNPPDTTVLSTPTQPFSEPGLITPPPTTESLTVEKHEVENQRLQAENAALKQQLSAHQAEKAAQAANLAHEVNVVFAENLINEARLAPAGQAVVVALLDALSGKEKALTFSEGSTTQPLVDAVKSLLTSATPLVDFGQRAVPGRGNTPQNSLTFSERASDPDTLHQQAMALKARETMSYEAAVKRCLSGESHV